MNGFDNARSYKRKPGHCSVRLKAISGLEYAMYDSLP